MSDSEKEIERATHLLFHLKKRCAFCYTPTSPLWRRGWYDKNLKKDLPLCNCHGLRYKKNQYCLGCNYIYLVKEVTPRDWLYCISCGRWTHKKCDPKKYDPKKCDPRFDEDYFCFNCR